MAVDSFSVVSRSAVTLPSPADDIPYAYQTLWDAAANEPALASGVGNKGDVYKVMTAGSTNLDGNSFWLPGDLVAFNGTSWDRIIGNNSVVHIGGDWNANTNDLGLVSSVGKKGEMHRVSVAGATSLNGMAIWAVGDYAFFNGSVWSKLSAYDDTHVVKDNLAAVISKGRTFTPVNLGTLANFTPDPTLGNFQYGTNNGAFTITSPIVDCEMKIRITNGATAGSISFSGFTAPTGGGADVYATTNGQKFDLYISRLNGITTYAFKALQ